MVKVLIVKGLDGPSKERSSRIRNYYTPELKMFETVTAASDETLSTSPKIDIKEENIDYLNAAKLQGYDLILTDIDEADNPRFYSKLKEALISLKKTQAQHYLPNVVMFSTREPTEEMKRAVPRELQEDVQLARYDHSQPFISKAIHSISARPGAVPEQEVFAPHGVPQGALARGGMSRGDPNDEGMVDLFARPTNPRPTTPKQ